MPPAAKGGHPLWNPFPGHPEASRCFRMPKRQTPQEPPPAASVQERKTGTMRGNTDAIFLAARSGKKSTAAFAMRCRYVTARVFPTRLGMDRPLSRCAPPQAVPQKGGGQGIHAHSPSPACGATSRADVLGAPTVSFPEDGPTPRHRHGPVVLNGGAHPGVAGSPARCTGFFRGFFLAHTAGKTRKCNRIACCVLPGQERTAHGILLTVWHIRHGLNLAGLMRQAHEHPKERMA